MAEHHEEQEQEDQAPLEQLTTEIVAAYVSTNTVAMADLGQLIDSVGHQLKTLDREQAEPAPAKPEPAVPVRRSVQEDHLVCLICGKRQKTLRRHLDVAHQIMPEAYRELFDLKPDYPMTAPAYSRRRSEMAQRLWLGRRKQAPTRRRRRNAQT